MIVVRVFLCLASIVFSTACFIERSLAADLGLPVGVVNTQAPNDSPFSADESLEKVTVPAGFKVTLFAAEPDVAQPIAMAFDDRGRLWVVECFSYPDFAELAGKDRVLIFEDTDNDGHFDRRTVFLEDGVNLTGIEIGLGGVWLCSAPNLLFIPDRNADDVPDDEPQVVLDGWDYKKTRHNVFNGLNWGPDGWLYGCHGILGASLVGKPGTAESQRVQVSCGIWRYHPITEAFEIVTRGTTNPWGLDFNNYGHGFFTNCVIDHAWQMIPGARYKRMFGQDSNASAYGLMGPTSDHLHWQGDDWNTIGSDGELQSPLGGGHAHCGTMIYLGDNWPEMYRNGLMTLNVHGARMNHDQPQRRGSGYTATHAPDIFLSNSEWFRGVDLAYGPDGGVFVADWTDYGECHDHDGVHRSSGRIFKVTYGRPVNGEPLDISAMGNEQLAHLHLNRNDWYVRRARLALQHRAAEGIDVSDAILKLQYTLYKDTQVPRRLRALWTLHVIGALGHEDRLALLNDPSEYLRGWAIRLELEDYGAPQVMLDRFEQMAREDNSALVRLELASGLQRMQMSKRWPVAIALASRKDDARDANLPLMIWYGIEPALTVDPKHGSDLMAASAIPLIRQFTARRVTELNYGNPVKGVREASVQRDALAGMLEGLRGRRDVPSPVDWAETYAILRVSDDAYVRSAAALVATVYGDESAKNDLRLLMVDSGAATDERPEALRVLLDVRDKQLPQTLQALIGDENLAAQAIRGLAAFDDPATPGALLKSYAGHGDAIRSEIIATLSARPSYADALLDAVADGRVPQKDISAFAARQIFNLGDRGVQEKINRVWGVMQTSDKDKKRLLTRYKALLRPGKVSGVDLSNGRAVFTQACASCHKLFGDGGVIGPDLTGSDRTNVDYVLSNVIDPNKEVANDYILTTVQMKDGRIIAGMVKGGNDDVLKMQTANDSLTINRSDIETLNRSSVSMMPEGLLPTMSDQDVIDLVAYLQSTRQVPLP